MKLKPLLKSISIEHILKSNLWVMILWTTNGSRSLCKFIQVINLNIFNSILEPLDKALVALFGSFLPLYKGIPTKPYKRHITGSLLH